MEQKWIYKIFIISLVLLSLTAFLYFYFSKQTLLFFDSISRLNIAKRVLDSITPGLVQLGGVWLPLPQLFMLPFIKSDFLWHSGLAGTILSIVCFILACVVIFKLVYLLTNDYFCGLIASAAFALNPNMLYLQSTALSEPMMVLFITLTVYYVCKWSLSNRCTDLAFAGLFSFLGSLVRYEGWALIVVMLLIIICNSYRANKNYHYTEANLLIYGLPAFYGPILWLLYNRAIFKDAFYFAHSKYSAYALAQAKAVAGELPTYHNMTNSIICYGYSTAAVGGTFISALALAGLIYFFYNQKRLKDIFLPALAILVPFPFYIISLYLGQVQMYCPIIYPYALMNLRYACLILPAVCIFVGYFASLSKYLKLVLLVVVLLQSLWLTKPANFVILKEANQATPQEELVIAEWLKDNYKGGRILIAVGLTGLDAVIFHSQLPMNRFISEGQGEYWQGGLRELKGVDWVITKPRDEVWQSVIAREKFTDSFVKVFETKNIFVYKRKNLP